MTNIIKFPRSKAAPAEAPAAAPAAASSAPGPVTAPAAGPTAGRRLAGGLLRLVWVALVLVWPVLKWVLSIEVFFQFLRMLFLWDEPGAYAGWTFLAHFAALTALTYFVSLYKPKGL